MSNATQLLEEGLIFCCKGHMNYLPFAGLGIRSSHTKLLARVLAAFSAPSKYTETLNIITTHMQVWYIKQGGRDMNKDSKPGRGRTPRNAFAQSNIFVIGLFLHPVPHRVFDLIQMGTNTNKLTLWSPIRENKLSYKLEPIISQILLYFKHLGTKTSPVFQTNSDRVLGLEENTFDQNYLLSPRRP